MGLIAESISFSYPKGPRVLDSVSCTVQAGTLTAIVGPNGAGKSTLVRLLAGLRTPHSGSVRLGDQHLHSFHPRQRAQRIAFLEQRPSLAFDFSVMRVVSFGAFACERDCALITDALQRFELTDIAHKPFASLSVGQQQRTAFARAWVQIASRPGAFLLADEPCSAMDPRHTLQTMGAMRELAESGIGVGVVVHDLNIAARFADRAVVLNQAGLLVREGPIDEAMDPAILESVFEVPIERFTLSGRSSVLVVGDP
ncbi:MAG: ABC transporter ATP-binding protein [Phycisphaerales bacterium]|nr:ABC transporter ATP-binding protein [Phycisphaerales bacterium]